MKRLILVPGTWGWKDGQWWDPASPFVANLLQQGLAVESFVWSTNVDGLFKQEHRGWRAAGVHLFNDIVPRRCPEKRIPPSETVIVAHSHAGQAALYAAAEGLRIDLLVTVATPVRGDMATVIEKARPNIRIWRHLHSSWRDWMQVFGEIGDGRFGIRRTFPEADENCKVPEAGHSGFLNDARFADRWTPSAWLRPGLTPTYLESVL